jgi:hypothetical protein
MKKIAVVFGVLLVLAVLVLAGGYVWLSSYVRTDAFRAQVEAQVSKALGAEVKIGAIGLSWKGLSLERLRIPNPAPFDAKNAFFTLDHGAVGIVWQSLFQGTVQVTRVELDAPVLTLYQNSQGAMALPFAKKAEGATVPAGKETGGAGKEVAIGEILLQHARVQGFDSTGAQLFLVEDAVLKTSYRRSADGRQSAQGELKIGRLVAGTALMLTRLASPVAVEGDRIDLTGITGAAYSGTASGKAGVDLSSKANSFYMTLKLDRMNLAELMEGMQAGSKAGGAVDFTLDVKGSLDAPKDLTGPGSFVVSDIETAQLKGMKGKQEGLGGLLTLLSLIPRIAEPLGQVAGSLSGISVLQEGKISSATGQFQMGRQRMEYSKLFVDAGELDIDLKGTMTFDSELDLQGDVVLGPKLAGSLSGLVSGQPGSAQEQRLPMTIRGPSSSPKVSINPAGVLMNTGTQLLDRFLRPGSGAPSGGNTTTPEGQPKEEKSLLPGGFKGLFQ